MIVTDLAASESGCEQAVRVSFVQSTQADTRTLQTFSGNPGYLKGYPVLVSRHALPACLPATFHWVTAWARVDIWVQSSISRCNQALLVCLPAGG
jgi:hypothetical protein